MDVDELELDEDDNELLESPNELLECANELLENANELVEYPNDEVEDMPSDVLDEKTSDELLKSVKVIEKSDRTSPDPKEIKVTNKDQTPTVTAIVSPSSVKACL